MNPNHVGPSYLFSSSSSSDDELEELINSYNLDNQIIAQQIYNNNLIIASYLTQNPTPSHGGSVPGRRTVNRDREEAARRLFNDYFAENPIFDETHFRRRFRMSRHLFTRITDAVKAHDEYFLQWRDAVGRLGLSTLQKMTAAIRILAYALPADATDEYINIGESTAIECVKRFCRAIVEIFGDQYLRSPTPNDIARLLHIGKQRGFPGMLGSLDCMHWKWKNCPTGWAGQYAGRSGSPTIILEAIADYDLWIWHAYFGMPGSNNDINVLERSHLFSDLARGIAPPANYMIRGVEYNMGYYLADNIYPKWSTLVQTIREPGNRKRRYFAERQEACRKDVERAFGVLQGRFAIVVNPARFWSKYDLQDIMTACIIMHNMIIEDERDLEAPIEVTTEVAEPTVELLDKDQGQQFHAFLARFRRIKDKDAHYKLHNDLVDHLWDEYTNNVVN